MATLATDRADFRSVAVNDAATISDEAAWTAVMALSLIQHLTLPTN